MTTYGLTDRVIEHAFLACVKRGWHSLPEDLRNAMWLLPLIGVIYVVTNPLCSHAHH